MTDANLVTVCPRCAVGCSLAYDGDTGRATGREGAVNRDGRLCPKGIASFDGLREDRLTTPLVREGDDLVPASWDEAYDHVVEGFDRVRRERGPDALAFLGSPRGTNEEAYLFQRIARLLGTNNVDNRARSCHGSAAAAMRDRLGSSAMTNSVADLGGADAFLVVGANPAARQPIAFDTAVRPAVASGATLIHVDPRATETTRLADHHLAARPGTDARLLAALAAVVVDEGLVDEEFVEARTTGSRALVEALARLDVDSVATTCGVPTGDLRAAARAFGSADRGAAIVGTGIEAADHEGTAAADALIDLLLLTGNLGRRGTGMNLFRGLANEQGAGDVGCVPFLLPGRATLDDRAARDRLADAWGVEPPNAPGRDELDLVQAFGDDVAAAWVFGEDPATTRLDDDAVKRGMAALDCLVVQDTTLSRTAARADVVLPASAPAEKDGTVTSMDRTVQRVRAVRPLPDGARRDLRILRDLGARLTDSSFAFDGPRAVFEELAGVSSIHGGLSYPAIERGGQRWPIDGAGDGVAVLHRDRFAHGGRRAPFSAGPPEGSPAECSPSAEAPTDDGPSAEGPTDGGLVLVTSRRIDEFVGEPPETDDRTIQVHPEDAGSRGLSDGEAVVLATGRGRAEAVVSVTAEVRPGTVFAPAGVAEPVLGTGRSTVRLLLSADTGGEGR